MYGTGQLPKFKSTTCFSVEDPERELYLIPTAEVPRDQSLSRRSHRRRKAAAQVTAYTPCFRSEAGSYGKDVRGIIRQHQFQKVELVKFAKPEDSYEELGSINARCREHPANASACLFGSMAALHRRHGLLFRQDVRYRSLAARASSSTAKFRPARTSKPSRRAARISVIARRASKIGIRTHAQRQRPRRRTHLAGDPRKLPAS